MTAPLAPHAPADLPHAAGHHRALGASPTGADPTAADPTPQQRWRRNRLLVGAGVVVVAGAVLVTLAAPASHRADLDPRSYSPTGTHALAALLAARGVSVQTETDTETAERDALAASTLVVVHPSYLSAAELRALASTPADLVVVGASSYDLAGLDLGVEPAEPDSTADTRVAPACSLPASTVAGAVDVGGSGDVQAYRAPAGGLGCYPDGDGFALVSLSRDGRRITLLGSATPLTNAALANQGDAALALGLLDAHPVVEWLLPPALPPQTATGPSKTVTDLLPSRLKLAVLQLAIAVGLVALWRGRRLGRLVAEDIPVVVRQSETVLGRGRLYRRSRSLGQAAQALRDGTRGRLTGRLGLGPEASQAALVGAIAARVGRPAGDIDGVLYGATPIDDRALVALAQALTNLEQEVLRT